MPTIELQTPIKASIEVVFDLSRSIDLHKISTQHTYEEAIAGVTSGLIELGESVSWRARHFGIYQKLTSRITAFDKPYYFVDEMEKGIFDSFKHEHIFKQMEGQVLMVDVFDYSSPLGILGKFADFLFLKNYMEKLLKKRNEVIKQFAESNRWRELLN
ncbi:MAG: SRPBCC family protein [Bacteroidia bacterium]|nr:SRPBCC family protein [Bacteroidia bacterium]